MDGVIKYNANAVNGIVIEVGVVEKWKMEFADKIDWKWKPHQTFTEPCPHGASPHSSLARFSYKETIRSCPVARPTLNVSCEDMKWSC